jgi:hypothetical protein
MNVEATRLVDVPFDAKNAHIYWKPLPTPPVVDRVARGISSVAIVLAVLALALALSGCGAPASALKACEVYLRVNRAHVDDATLPPAARSIALDNADAWEVMREDLGGAPTSAATKKRIGAGASPR